MDVNANEMKSPQIKQFGEAGTSDEPRPSNEKKTLYVGNLSTDVNEYMLSTVFSPFGVCVSIKIMRDPSNRFDPYAFIEFSDNFQANLALTAMNHIKFMGKELLVNWATTPAQGGKKQGHSIFVGDLGLDIDDSQLHDAFISFGPIIESKIVRYLDGRSRGYAFITFENETDAEEAISRMDRSWLLNKSIRCNWATRKAVTYENKPHFLPKKYEEVLKEASETNCTVYCGGIMNGMSEDIIRDKFRPYGAILDLKIFRDKGFAFVKLGSHELAAKAISELHSTNFENFVIKCSWGKENFSSNNTLQATPGSGAPQQYGDYYKQYYEYCQNYYNYYYQYWRQQSQAQQMNENGNQVESGANGPPLLGQPDEAMVPSSGFRGIPPTDARGSAFAPPACPYNAPSRPTTSASGGPVYTARFGNSRQHPYWAQGTAPRFGEGGPRPSAPGRPFPRPMYN